MFTLLRNFRTMFMLSVANYQQMSETPVDTAIEDKELSLKDIEALSSIPEAQEAILAKMEGELSLAGEIASELGDITPDPKEGNPTLGKQKNLQFIINLFLKASGQSTILMDGRIGGGTKKVLTSIMSDYDGGVIDQGRISLLIQMTNSKLKDKISEVKAQREAQEKAKTEATAVVSGFDWEKRDSASIDDIKALQTALKILGYPINTIDGVITPKRATEKSYVAEMTKVRGAQQAAKTAAATVGVAKAKVALNAAEAEDLSTDVAEARERGEMERAQAALKAAEKAAEDTQLIRDAALNYTKESLDGVRSANEAKTLAQTALDGATQAAVDAQAALDAAELSRNRANMDVITRGSAISTAQSALETATQAAVDAQEALDAAAIIDADADSEVGIASMLVGLKETQVRSAAEKLTQATSIRERVQGRVTAIKYITARVNKTPDVTGISVQDAQAAFDAAQTAYGSAVTTGDFISNIEATDWEFGGKDEAYFNAAIVLSLVNERDAQTALDAANQAAIDAQTALDAANQAAIETQDALDAADALDLAADIAAAEKQAELDAVNQSVIDARAALVTATAALDAAAAADALADTEAAAADTAFQAAQQSVTSAEDALRTASSALQNARTKDEAADQEVLDADATHTTQAAEHADALTAQSDADDALTQAQAGLEAAKEAELDAYINELTEGGKNKELVEMIAANPKMREMIARLKTMPAARVGSLGNALGYFGVSGDFVGAGEVTGELVVAIAKHSQKEQIPVSEMSAEYIIQLNEAYQEKADELGKMLTELNTRGFLDTGKAAAENFFNTTVGYPDMEYVTQEGVFSISNGLRGRPRCHHHTSYTTTNTYKTTQNNHVLQDHAGKETLGSTHTSSTEKVGSKTTSKTSTKKWFEMHAGGMEREAISELIASGKATLRPSYQMLSRLYEAKANGQGQVELVEQSWYKEMQGWAETNKQREGGEMTIINKDVSIRSKTLGSAMSEVQSEAPDRYAEIQKEVQADLVAADEFSFLIWDAETGERANSVQLVGRKQTLPSGKTTWALATFDPASGKTLKNENFASQEEMLASSMGQKAIEMSMYRYLGVVDTTTEGGLRAVDDQGLIRCGKHEKVVLLDDPAPVLPQGYNFLRNGLPCGVLGAFCTSSSSHKTNVKKLHENKWTYDKKPKDPNTNPNGEPEGENPNDAVGSAGSTGTTGESVGGVGTGGVAEGNSGSQGVSDAGELD